MLLDNWSSWGLICKKKNKKNPELKRKKNINGSIKLIQRYPSLRRPRDPKLDFSLEYWDETSIMVNELHGLFFFLYFADCCFAVTLLKLWVHLFFNLFNASVFVWFFYLFLALICSKPQYGRFNQRKITLKLFAIHQIKDGSIAKTNRLKARQQSALENLDQQWGIWRDLGCKKLQQGQSSSLAIHPEAQWTLALWRYFMECTQEFVVACCICSQHRSSHLAGLPLPFSISTLVLYIPELFSLIYPTLKETRSVYQLLTVCPSQQTSFLYPSSPLPKRHVNCCYAMFPTCSPDALFLPLCPWGTEELGDQNGTVLHHISFWAKRLWLCTQCSTHLHCWPVILPLLPRVSISMSFLHKKERPMSLPSRRSSGTSTAHGSRLALLEQSRALHSNLVYTWSAGSALQHP